MAIRTTRAKKSPIANRSKIIVSTFSPPSSVSPISPSSPLSSVLKTSPTPPPSSVLPISPSSPSLFKDKMILNLPRVHQLSVSNMFQSHLDSLHSTVEMDLQPKSAFYVADLGEVYRLHLRWKALLPHIEPFYALGAGFDCASMSEIRMMVELGVNLDKIVHANPCKEITQVKYARANNVLGESGAFNLLDEAAVLANYIDAFPEHPYHQGDTGLATKDLRTKLRKILSNSPQLNFLPRNETSTEMQPSAQLILYLGRPERKYATEEGVTLSG
ncbi:hypothetical protein BKA57DRAFT_510263 [Linnemannia elongata]|nr:hypothetical protein BKA57DRAFT_510263 [Linnemannia elongata]